MRKILTKLTILVLLAFSVINAWGQSPCTSTRDPWITRGTASGDLNQLVPFLGSGGPTNYYRNDDAHTAVITLPFHFCFYGTSYNSIVIDNNGYITFPASNSIVTSSASYTPVSFPISGPNMIAPFWADVYTTTSTSSYAMNTVWYIITPHYVAVQWDSVGYYDNQHNYYNSFQCIISDGTSPIIPNGNNIDFAYKEMEWCEGQVTQPNGSGFGGTNPATVGLNDANGTNYIQVGRFDNPSNIYVGPNPGTSSADGIYWLNGQEFMFNTCTNEAPPIVGYVTPCDTFRVCQNDSLFVHLAIWSPIPGQIVHSALNAPVPPNTSITYNVPGNRDSLIIRVIGSASTLGYHIVYFYGFDNHSPSSDTTFSSFVVDVLSSPPPITVTASPDTICPNGNSMLTASGANSYVWSTGNTYASFVVTPSSTQTYTVTANTGCGTTTKTIQVVVGTNPVITVTPPNPSTCPGDSVQLFASGAATYVWTSFGGSPLSCDSCPDPWAQGPANSSFANSYFVTGTSSYGCTSSAFVSVTSHPGPTVTASTSQDSLCYGHSANLNAIGVGGNITYNWAPASGLSCTNCPSPVATPTVPTMYTVTVTDSSGCTGRDSVHIYVTPALPLSIVGNISLCYGDSEVLTALGGGSFTWQPGGSTGATLAIKPTVTTKYKVSMSVPICGTQTDSITVYVNPKPVMAFTTNPPDSGCAPLCVQFNNLSTITSGNITHWKWEFGNGDISNASAPLACYNGAGTFNVGLVATSDSGCSDSLTKVNLINVFGRPQGNFTASPQPTTIMAPTIQFTNNVSDGYGMPSWHWNFGERGDTVSDSVSVLQNPSHTYGDTGTFCVQLIALNNHGCTDTVVNCVEIQSLFVIYIPSAFTPNGDGKNDRFLPEGNFKTFEMYIYDRWGMQVFHTTDMNIGWNGQVNGAGTISQEDTYIYLIKVTDEKNTKHTFTGEVNLIR